MDTDEQTILCDIWHKFDIAADLKSARHAQVETARKILDKGVRIPQDALKDACTCGSLEGMKLLMAYGADINEKDHAEFDELWGRTVRNHSSSTMQPKRTVLHEVARNPCGFYTRLFDFKPEKIEWFEATANGVEMPDPDVKSKRLARPDEVEPVDVKTLIDLGADPDIQNAHGRIALHFALESGNVEGAKILACHSNPNLLTNKGENAFHFIAMAGLTPYDRQICRNTQERDPSDLGFAEQPKAVDLEEILKIMLSRASLGALEVECSIARPGTIKRPRRGTPLAIAIEFADREKVQLLLAHGAKMPPPEALTLDWAVDDTDLHWFNWLVNRGARTESNIVDDVVQAFAASSILTRTEAAERRRKELRKIFNRVVELGNNIRPAQEPRKRTYPDDVRSWKRRYYNSTRYGKKGDTTLGETVFALNRDGDEDDCFRMVKAVVEAGADVLEKNSSLLPPIALAKWPRTREYLRERMREKGWDIDLYKMILIPLDDSKKPVQLRDVNGVPQTKPYFL